MRRIESYAEGNTRTAVQSADVRGRVHIYIVMEVVQQEVVG
jgi:hypothetical protein